MRVTTDHPFHIRLQRIMYDKDVSQACLAKRLGVTRTCVNLWYWGINQPSIESLKSIRRVLGCEWDELMGR
ncbi:MAG: helix-turn-helix transcriptional regulator [Prevotella sp.]